MCAQQPPMGPSSPPVIFGDAANHPPIALITNCNCPQQLFQPPLTAVAIATHLQVTLPPAQALLRGEPPAQGTWTPFVGSESHNLDGVTKLP